MASCTLQPLNCLSFTLGLAVWLSAELMMTRECAVCAGKQVVARFGAVLYSSRFHAALNFPVLRDLHDGHRSQEKILSSSPATDACPRCLCPQDLLLCLMNAVGTQRQSFQRTSQRVITWWRLRVLRVWLLGSLCVGSV